MQIWISSDSSSHELAYLNCVGYAARLGRRSHGIRKIRKQVRHEFGWFLFNDQGLVADAADDGYVSHNGCLSAVDRIKADIGAADVMDETDTS
jgi:hypothetical protein